MSELPSQRFLLAVIDLLERLKIPYMILGGFAVRTWGVPRPTYDADLAVEADPETLRALLGALEREGFTVPEEFKRGYVDTVSGMGKLKVTRFEAPTVWDVDLFLVRGALLESALKRRRSVSFSGQAAWVVAPEDLILLKLIAHRRKDQLDVEEVLKITKDLDLVYLRAWARKLGLAGRLEEFLDEV